MTYLSLSQDLAREVGVSPGPSDVTSQIGELERLVKWVSQAYVEIQNRTYWRWMRHGFTFSTVADDDTYAYSDATDTTSSSAISRFRCWYLKDRQNPPKIYLTASGVGVQTYLTFIDWAHFNQIYRLGTQNSGAPAHISIDPQNNLVLGPKPNDVYTVTGEYYRSAQVLAADADVPEMPSDYHYLIVYEAMKKYAGFESAPEVYSRAINEGSTVKRQLEVNQAPVIGRGASLA